MELFLSEEKVQKILMRWQKTLDQRLVSVREVSQLTGASSSNALAVLLAPLQYRYLQYGSIIIPCLQKRQIDELRTSPSYEKQIVLSPQSRAEIQWWVHNLKLSNRRFLVRKPPQLIIKLDTSKEGWGIHLGRKDREALGPRRRENFTSMYWN